MIVKNPVESILALAASVFDAYSIVLFDEPQNQKAPLVAAYCLEDCLDQNAVAIPGKGLVGWILRNNTPIVAGSIDESGAYLGYYKENAEPKICSFLGFPLSGGGVLCIDSLQRNAFSAEKQKLVSVFADILVQTRALEEPAEDAQKEPLLQALSHLAQLRREYSGWNGYLEQALPILLEASGFSYAVFAARGEGNASYMVEGESPNLVKKDEKPLEISVHHGVLGWVLRNGEPVYNDGHAGRVPLFGRREGYPEFRRLICVPVMMNGGTCGALCLAGDEEMPLGENLRAFVRLAADDLGRLLENLSLRYSLHRAEQREQEQKGRRY